MEDEDLGFWGSIFVWGWKMFWLFVILSIIISVFGVIFGQRSYKGRTAEEWYNEYNQSEDDVVMYKTAFEEANTKIEEANNNIEEANNSIDDTNTKIKRVKSSVYSGDYNDLQYQIDRLKPIEAINTVDTVSEP